MGFPPVFQTVLKEDTDDTSQIQPGKTRHKRSSGPRQRPDADKKIIVNESIETNLDTHGTTTVNLPPTGTGWAYTLHVGANGSRHEFAVTFDVPDTTNTLNFADLVTVDPTTLTPTTTGNPLADIDQSDIDWALAAIRN